MRMTAAVLAVLAVVLGAGVLTAAPAEALRSGTRSDRPWVVEVYGTLFGLQTTTCTGTAIAADWVLTADHCPADRVFYRYAPTPGAEEIRAEVPVAESISLAPADMKLVRLAQPQELPSYPALLPDGYRVGSVGEVYGMGDDFFALQRREKVWVVRQGRMPKGIIGIHTTGTTGGAEQIGQTGDSGGPLIVAGRLVGVFFATTMPDEPVQMMAFSDVRPAVAKLKELQKHGRFPREATFDRTPGIMDVSVAHDRLQVTLSDELMHSGKRVVVWVDGRYVGELADGRLIYSQKREVPGGATMIPTTPVADGGLVQIGELASGVEVREADLLFQQRLNGVDAVRRSGDRLAVTLSRALVNSGKRVVIWVDGVYRAEVLDDVSLYASKTNIDDASIVVPDGAVEEGALVQIGVLPAGTDLEKAEILDARIL
ncbi:trypsin-like serine protease [Rathayibacter sp. VKM Ac-2856]|uniref:trypsin-like serine protease n=1 Tax=unclassified Rathayibacter TaxID=2609250 RepID=UPI00156535CD|nr:MULTISPECIES: trypsin-like serine protease [unclassified Rathayibacter]NQX03891.1 trypsin-like serine protease [Rathayibacter sp. VKM Ac-2858]NQX19059.1 trypsin-like serine protease [Rathayibacter sp. VKM Ac-2856]